MNKVLVYKTKLESKIQNDLSLSNEFQPHLTNLACVLCDEDTGEAIQVFDLVVNTGKELKENDFIDNDSVNEVGVDEGFAMMLFTMLARDCKKITASNDDQEAVVIAMSRYVRDEELNRLVDSFQTHHYHSDLLADDYNLVSNIDNIKEVIESCNLK